MVNLNLTDRVRIFLFATLSDTTMPRRPEDVLVKTGQESPVFSSLGEDLLRADTGFGTGTGVSTGTGDDFDTESGF